jgi:biotin transport system substrate-specific component
MQPFAVLLVGLLLSPREAFAALCLYLVEGASGLPVFTPMGAPGLARLFGPTAGYLLSYPMVATLASTLWRTGDKTIWRGVFATSIATLLLLATGASWLGILTHGSFKSIFYAAVVPFLPGEGLKVVAASAIASGWNRWRRN